MVRVSDGHHGKRQIRSDRVGHRRLFRHKWHREKGPDSCAGRSSEAKGNKRRRCPLDLWQMSGGSAARLPGRLLPCQHQSVGVRHDGLHRLETRPRSQGGSSEVSHRVSGRRGWVHVQANVPNQARAPSLGEKWTPNWGKAADLPSCTVLINAIKTQSNPHGKKVEPVDSNVVIAKIKSLK